MRGSDGAIAGPLERWRLPTPVFRRRVQGLWALLRPIQGEEVIRCDTIDAMSALTVTDKTAALDGLYGRIAQIADAMGGASARDTVPISHMAATVAEPRTESAPALHIQMPDDFRVEFTPSGPLSTPYILSVNIRCTHRGLMKHGSSTNFVGGLWRVGLVELSEEQVRSWLTLDGRPAIN